MSDKFDNLINKLFKIVITLIIITCILLLIDSIYYNPQIKKIETPSEKTISIEDFGKKIDNLEIEVNKLIIELKLYEKHRLEAQEYNKEFYNN